MNHDFNFKLTNEEVRKIAVELIGWNDDNLQTIGEYGVLYYPLQGIYFDPVNRDDDALKVLNTLSKLSRQKLYDQDVLNDMNNFGKNVCLEALRYLNEQCQI